MDVDNKEQFHSSASNPKRKRGGQKRREKHGNVLRIRHLRRAAAEERKLLKKEAEKQNELEEYRIQFDNFCFWCERPLKVNGILTDHSGCISQVFPSHSFE